MKELTGMLNLVEVLEGWDKEVRDIRVNVGGEDFYKRIWDPGKTRKYRLIGMPFDDEKKRNRIFMWFRRLSKKYKINEITKLCSQRNFEKYDRDSFIEDLRKGIGEKVVVKYVDVSTSPVYWVLDFFNGVNVPRNYREIEDFDISE